MTEKADELKRKWHEHLSTEGITKEDSVKFYAEVSDIVSPSQRVGNLKKLLVFFH